MKLKLNKVFFYALVLQVIATQGIFTFFVFDLIGNWELKSLLHPLSFLIIVIVFVLRSLHRISFTVIEFIFFIYLFAEFIVLFFNVSELSAGYLSFREVFMLFILIYIYNNTYIPRKKWNKILKVIYVFVIANIFFVGLTYVLNADDYMRLITGRFYWGMDPEYKFKISNFYIFWRSPGLVGSSGSLAYFGLLAYFLMDRQNEYKVKKWFAVILVAICFTRSAYLVLILYMMINFITNKENFSKIVLFLKYASPFIFIGVLYLTQYRLFSFESVLMRIDHWINDMNISYNIFFGGAIGKSGASVRNLGFVSVLDSYWLYMLYSIGIIGILLMFLFFYEKIYGIRKLAIFTISVSIAGIFITLTQAIPFLVLFPMLFLKVIDD